MKEVDIINKPREAREGDIDINHLPVVLGYEDFGYKTGDVRGALGLCDTEGGQPLSRVLRGIVFPCLRPITTLAGEGFVRAWFECVRCEYRKSMTHVHQPLILHVRSFQAVEAWFRTRQSNLMVDPVTKRA